MAFFVLNSDITIDGIRLSGVHNVEVRRSMHSISDTAIIQIPRKAKMQEGKMQEDGTIKILPHTATEVIPGKLFTDGAAVTIRLGYNGDLREEFKGFIRRRTLSMPLEIECEGYARQMRQNVTVNGMLKSTTVLEMMELAVGIKEIKDNKSVKVKKPKTDITIICQDDIPMHNIQFTAFNGVQVTEEIKKLTLGTISIFFITPTVLWCGFTYTPYVDKNDPFGNGEVNYRLGWNCIKDNGLRERIVDEPVQVILNNTLATGHVVQSKSAAEYATKKEKAVLNSIQDKEWMRKMANEKQYQMNYAGYEGYITGFLQPYCLPGYKANVRETDYSERDGTYMVESTKVIYGIGGARRVVELGPRIGFNPKNIVTR